MAIPIPVRHPVIMLLSTTRDGILTEMSWSGLREAAERGAGELLINSTSHDGNKRGYDIDLIRKVSSAVTVPVVAMGGVGELGSLR